MYYLLMAILVLFIMFSFYAGLVLFIEWIVDRERPSLYVLWMNKYK